MLLHFQVFLSLLHKRAAIGEMLHCVILFCTSPDIQGEEKKAFVIRVKGQRSALEVWKTH